MSAEHKCFTCGRKDVRLYRSGGKFYRPERVVCMVGCGTN